MPCPVIQLSFGEFWREGALRHERHIDTPQLGAAQIPPPSWQDVGTCIQCLTSPHRRIYRESWSWREGARGMQVQRPVRSQSHEEEGV